MYNTVCVLKVHVYSCLYPKVVHVLLTAKFMSQRVLSLYLSVYVYLFHYAFIGP